VTTQTAAELSRMADQAAAAGDVRKARVYLDQLSAVAPSFDIWLKLGAMCRAAGDGTGALSAVEKALALSPLDFMALLSRATLLERANSPEAAEAYGRALAQRPRTALPPAVQKMVDHGQTLFATDQARREEQLIHAMRSAEEAATADEARRIARFRSNALRKTKVWHSEPTHFHYPGLVEREFHDRAYFPWLSTLEAATQTIAAEFQAVVNAERAELVPYIQYAAHEPLDQWRALNHSRDWTAIHLIQNGRIIEANARHCKKTLELLAQIPQPLIKGCSANAMFSLLAPNTVIPPHTGITNTRLVCHLPLIIPDGCWFRVGAETREWQQGEAFVFDDTIEHEAANPTSELRAVFIIDIWHPGLSETEREAVRLLLEADAGGAGLAL
jgi:aspartyl/asparaginyl beta-hydroxylase (cupin superfamily)